MVDVAQHIIVRGRVQGVGFRAFVEHEALRAGVGGWTRNRRDGAVEAVFVGAPGKIEAVIAACRKGPHAARVDEIEQRDAQADELALRRPGELFSVLPTV